MKAFQVFINDHQVCLAGVGDDGVLHAIINWVGCHEKEEDIFLTVGGLDTTSDEHHHWDVPTIGVGSDILVRVVEAATVEPPNHSTRYEKPTSVEKYRQHLRECSSWLTENERVQLLQELIAELEELVK